MLEPTSGAQMQPPPENQGRVESMAFCGYCVLTLPAGISTKSRGCQVYASDGQLQSHRARSTPLHSPFVDVRAHKGGQATYPACTFVYSEKHSQETEAN